MSEPVKIKICGVRTPEVAVAAADAGAEAVGLVFVPDSPRYVTLEQARAVADAIRGRVELVGVFRDASADRIADAIAKVGLTRVQLHEESREHMGEVSPTPGVYAIAFDETAESQLNLLDPPDNLFAFLFDTPDTTKLGGGTGRTFDWQALLELLDRTRPSLPVIVAGGLTPKNVADAIRILRPWGVDTSSGVESSRGVKDVGKIKAFCDAVRSIA